MAAIGRRILMKPYGHGLANHHVTFAVQKLPISIGFMKTEGSNSFAMVSLTLSTDCGLPTKMNATNSEIWETVFVV